tara:strand:- start:79 stop:1167 length:1089 start_codon:yes stop_codon:yes gene_type:complete
MNRSVPKCVIVVPSLTPDGPIKGAIALANGLSDLGVEVSFVALKSGPGANSFLQPAITLHELNYSSLFSLLHMRVNVLKILSRLRSSSNETIVVISMCFSADLINVSLPSNIKKIVSVRGDLKENYTMDHGFFGRLLASIHYWLLNFSDLTVAMNSEMERLLSNYRYLRVVMIPNFINEIDFKSIEVYDKVRSGRSVVFVGSLTTRKKPFLLLETIISLNERGFDLDLFFVGDGPMKEELIRRVSQSGADRIHIMGFQESPSKIVINCDVLVLPSLSEGTPRSVMEALYLGTPCVMRSLSTNDNLVIDGVNGYLFDNDEDLEMAIVQALSLAKESIGTDSLLDESFSQNICSNKYLKAIEEL